MKPEILRKVYAGSTVALYILQKESVGLILLPAGMEDRLDEERIRDAEPLAHAALSGDVMENEYTNGVSMRYTETARTMRLLSQEEKDGVVVTLLADGRGHRIAHHLRPLPDASCFEVWTGFANDSGEEVWLEGITSFSLGWLSPLAEGARVDRMRIHRFRSFWAAEGRLLTQTAGELGLEPAWAIHGRRYEVFGNHCSMPVKEWFPTAVLEDGESGVSWGAQVYSPSSWQMEITCLNNSLSFAGGQGDYNHAHWRKKLAPGETYGSVKAVIGCARGGVDAVCANMVAAQRRGWENAPAAEKSLPIMFNEYCTTWGNPTHENLEKIAAVLRGRGIRYLTIDAGWYADKDLGWDRTSGDWKVSLEMFPHGLKAATDMIRDHGLIPGIWFEMETVAELAQVYGWTDHLLKRDGKVITVGSRRFWDMEDPFVIDYLSEKVIGLLKENGIGYLKVDYNEVFGLGCDGYESLGEGLRRKMEGTQAFFRKIREEIPDLVIENCSSGGHRLEPSMMALVSQASFSDAHESLDIPVIAANLQRLVLPAQNQIWAVLHGTDDSHRLWYSLNATLLGRMCLSGDVFDLDADQWAIVEEAMDFYRAAAPIIDRGVTSILTPDPASYRFLDGVQAVWRQDGDRALLVVHRYPCEDTALSVPAGWKVVSRCGTGISRVEDGTLFVEGGSYSSDAYILARA